MMRRFKEMVQSLKDMTSFGRKEYNDAVAMRQKLEAEIKRVSGLEREIQEAHESLPDALAKIRSEVEHLGVQNKKQNEIMEQIKNRTASPDDMAKLMAELGNSKLPDLGPLYDVIEKVKLKEDKKKD
jgi:hypothetical protein